MGAHVSVHCDKFAAISGDSECALASIFTTFKEFRLTILYGNCGDSESEDFLSNIMEYEVVTSSILGYIFV